VGVLQRDGGVPIDYDQPLGDAGLFGPQSVTWRVHADFPGMMAGGVAALMLQTLHPLALAGVWDHSSFRTDILGRLRRTTAFVAGTTYAPSGEAERLIALVRGIHRRVRGTAPGGQRYSAMNPALLTWVHCTEVASFLAGYRFYCGVEMPAPLVDRYLAETAVVARALGARKVPETGAALQAYFAAVQPQLEYSARSRAVLEALADIHLPIPFAEPARGLFLGAGAAVLPVWGLERLGFSRLQRARHQVAARLLRQMAPLLRAALREGVAARACRRMGVSSTALQTLPFSSD
jgi:uncharacterized protein (DUF2236 family)